MWSRKQRRTFKHLTSWMSLQRGRGAQLFRVDLTSVPGTDEKNLTPWFKRLRRAVEIKFGYRVDYFKIQTEEGNGVLHMVWAIVHGGAVWIPQEWLSAEWEKITGAKVVYIKRIGKDKGNVRRIGRYCVQQYLAGQDAIVRVSWSWWRAGLSLCKGFGEFYKECRQGFTTQRMLGLSPFTGDISYGEMIDGWTTLLETGRVRLPGAWFMIRGKEIDVAYDGGF